MKKSGGAIFLNVLGVFASIILSILFVIVATALPVYYSVAGMLQPKTITTVIQNIDYVEVLRESEAVNSFIEGIGIDTKIANDIMKSDEVGGLLRDCADKITEVLGDAAAEISELDAEFLKGLIDNHIDGIVEVAGEKMDIPVNKDEIKNGLKQYIDENTEEIGETFKGLESVKETIVTYSAVTETVQNTLKWYFVLGLALVGAAFLGLIYLMRKRNFGGFIWIAVDTGIVGLIVTAVVVVIKSSLLKEIIAEFPTFATGIVDSAIGAAATRLIIALAVCFVIMIGSIVACVLLRKRAKNQAMAPVTEEAPITEETAEQ